MNEKTRSRSMSIETESEHLTKISQVYGSLPMEEGDQRCEDDCQGQKQLPWHSGGTLIADMQSFQETSELGISKAP